jgi:tetratricopeptide (TPR) repeat protein
MGQQQQVQGKKRKSLPPGFWIAIAIALVLVVALAITSAWILTHQGITQGTATLTIVSIIGGLILALIAALFTYLQWRYPIPTDTAASVSPSPTLQAPSPTPIIIQLQQPTPPQTPQPSTPPSPAPNKPISGNITGSFPPTDPKTIQQRQKLVEQVYAELTKPGINCLVLTGIGGIGKSTLAALLYNYAEEQRKAVKGPFTTEALWITVEETTATFAYLAETISALLDKPIPDFGKLPPQNQAAALFNLLNAIDHSCLIVINQFENLLDSQTGQASDPGLGEWLDILNSRLCRCRVLLTSRPMPRGTHDYPPTHMQECPVEGLETNEGVELLRKQGVRTAQATDAELRIAVARCAGHALSLELLASILRRNQSLSLHSLFNNPIYAQLWTGNIARKLLDYIYKQQLDDVQRQLLQAFSVYREPVPLEAAQILLETRASQMQVLDAFNVLLSQHLLTDTGNECYQLHAIVAEYVQGHFVERDEQANKQALRAAHARAAQYYLQQAEIKCPPRGSRRKVDDVQPLIEAFWQYCQAGQWQEAYDLVWQEGVFADLKDWGSNAILLELCQLLLPLDDWQPQPQQESEIYYYLGRAYEVLGKKKRAIEYYGQALEICKKGKNRQGESDMLNNLGLVYNALGKKQEALRYYEQALAISREVGDRGGEGTTLNNLGGVYNALGKKQEALSYYEQALAIRREVGDRGGEGTTLNNLGLVYNALGKKQKALSYFEQALAIRREVGDRGGEGTTLNNLGLVYNALGKQEEALGYFEQALAIRREVGDRGGEGTTLNNLGGVYDALGKQEEALGYYEQALAIGREVGDRGGEGATLWNIGALYFEQARYDVALASLFLAREIFEEVQSPNLDGVQGWIDGLSGKIGEEQFTALLAQVEPQAAEIVERALREGL